MQEKLSTIEEKKIENYEIAELIDPLKDIIKEMLPNIEKGEYDLIIGIDASGRIPTLVIEKFIKHVYSKKGLIMPNVGFVAGKISRENAESRIKKWKPLKKVLIIEDTVAYGSSISGLCSALSSLGIKFDIATISLLNPAEVDEIKESLGAGNIFRGSEWGEPGIYGAHDLSGVAKQGEGEAHSVPYKPFYKDEFGDPRVEEEIQEELQERVNEARADANIVADHLIDWYESRTKSDLS